MSSDHDDESQSEHADGAGHLTIAQLSRLIDVPAPTIRSWERRYGLPQAIRTSAGHRRYLPAQVQAMRRMRDAIARGQSAGEAASLARTAQMRSEAARPLIDAVLQGAQQMDTGEVSTALDSAQAKLGLDATIDDVLLPAMRQIGRDWQTQRCDVAHEHLATEAIRAWLSRVAADTKPFSEGRPPIILTCGPDDYHTLGLDAIGALLRQRGRDCRLLGASVPMESLSAAVRQIRPAAVVLVSHLSVGRRSAVDALRAVVRAFDESHLDNARIFYAGNAFQSSRSRQGVPGTYLGDDLSYAADLITA